LEENWSFAGAGRGRSGAALARGPAEREDRWWPRGQPPEERIIDRIDTYFEAWNESDASRRRALLERCVSAEAELLDPTGRFRGLDSLRDRIGAFATGACTAS
jgi:hypothetical protein